MNARFAAVICAAGSSSRMGGFKKEYRLFSPERADRDGKPLTVLGAALAAFAAFTDISPIVVTIPAGGEEKAAAAIPKYLLEEGRVFLAAGGKSRRESVHNALSFLREFPVSYVLIHDGARPWVSSVLIQNVMDAALRHDAAVPVVPAFETPKLLDASGFVKCHLRRTELGLAQTPQGFAFPQILFAHEKAARRESEDNREYTDDAEVWGEFAGPVAAVPGEAQNRKITFPGDLS